MIDHALSRFRSYLPDVTPDETAKRELARQVIATADTLPAPQQTRRRGLVVATATGLAAVGALGIVMTKVDRRSSAAPIVVGEARVDWGMRALITVTPDPGVSVEDATQRAKELLAERLKRMDVQGAEVSSPEPGQLSLKVPGAEAPSQFSFVPNMPHVRIYRPEQVIASGGNLDELRRALGGRPVGANPRYLVEYTSPGMPSGMAAPAFVTESASQAQGYAAKRGYRVLPIDRSWTYSLQTTPVGRHTLIAGPPAVPSSVLELAVVGTTPVIRYPSRDGTGSTDDLIVVPGGSGTGGGVSATVDHETTTTVEKGETRVITLAPMTVNTMNPVDGFVTLLRDEAVTSPRSLTGSLLITSFGRYGTAPSTGTPVRRPALFTAATVYTPRDSRWSRVFTAERDHVTATTYRWESPEGRVGAAFTFTDSRGGFIAGPLNSSGDASGWCPVGLGSPLVNPCGGRSSISSGGEEAGRGTILSMGRVDPSVARLEARLPSGRVFPADIDGTWYTVLTSPALSTGDLEVTPVLVAYDRDGNVLSEAKAAPIRP